MQAENYEEAEMLYRYIYVGDGLIKLMWISVDMIVFSWNSQSYVGVICKKTWVNSTANIIFLSVRIKDAESKDCSQHW